jgi:hypothetical protein
VKPLILRPGYCHLIHAIHWLLTLTTTDTLHTIPTTCSSIAHHLIALPVKPLILPSRAVVVLPTERVVTMAADSQPITINLLQRPTCEALDLALTRLLVEALGVALLTDADGHLQPGQPAVKADATARVSGRRRAATVQRTALLCCRMTTVAASLLRCSSRACYLRCWHVCQCCLLIGYEFASI